MEYDEAISFNNLLVALKRCVKGSLWKASTAGYWIHRLENTYKLRQELLNGKYRISRYLWFTITEPKEREIYASYIKDRQHQHAFIDNIVIPRLSQVFVQGNCACQKGKGAKYCIDYLLRKVREYARINGNNGYVLKCDIKKFFPSTNHEIACNEIALYLDAKTTKACQDVIRSFSEISFAKILMQIGMDKKNAQTVGHNISSHLIYGGSYDSSLEKLTEEQKNKIEKTIKENNYCGVGLGSQVTQTTQIALLHRSLDEFVIKELNVPVYVRYMDDFILIDPDKQRLKFCLGEISKKLSALKLSLNPKTQLMPLSQGFKLLHWEISVTTTGKVHIRKDKIKINKEFRKILKQKKLVLKGKMTIEQVEQSFLCWQSCLLQQNCYWQIMRARKFYYKQFKRRAPEWNLKKRLWKKLERERITIITEAKKKMC